MPSYPQGRTSQLATNRFFGGLNADGSQLDLQPDEAMDLLNVEFYPSGGIRPRAGFESLSGPYTHPAILSFFTDTAGTIHYVIVYDQTIETATSLSGPWTDVTNGVPIVVSSEPWFAANGFGRLFLANADNQPIVIEDGVGARTLKAASLVSGPSFMPTESVGGSYTAGSTYIPVYSISYLTGRGETRPSLTLATVPLGQYNSGAPFECWPIITWQNRLGITGVRVYKSGGLAIELGPTETSWADTGNASPDYGDGPVSVSTAYNTPEYWETNLPPSGCGMVNKGRNARLVFWRGNRIWASALNNPFDFFGLNDAFELNLVGSDSTTIRAMATLYDFTVFYTDTNGYYYTTFSATATDLSKITNYGMSSQASLTNVENDAYGWSQYGPSTVKRILQGADVEGDPLARRVMSIVGSTDPTTWKDISVIHNPKLRRVMWAYTPPGGALNSAMLVWDYNNKLWSKFDGIPVLNSILDPASREPYALLTDGRLVHLFTGEDDDGDDIPWHYETGDQDMRTWLGKSLPWVDMMVANDNMDYNMTFSVTWDSGRLTLPAQTLTKTTTDGRVIATTTSEITKHRCYTYGYGRYFRFRVSGSSATGRPTVLAWRPEARIGGISE